MSNLKIGNKLLVSFIIVIVFSLGVGIFGIIGMTNLYYGYSDDYFAYLYGSIALIVAAVTVSVILRIYLGRNIAKPIETFNEWLQITADGNIVWTAEETAFVNGMVIRKDEIGELYASYKKLTGYMNEVGEELVQVANGNLDLSIKPHCENDLLQINLKTMVDDLSGIVSQIRNASDEASSGASQVALGATTIAQDSLKNDEAVKRLTDAINEILNHIHEDAENTKRAAELAETIMSNAEKGSGQMDEMTTAVAEIEKASQSISKVIKVIDDIAFQTNILALNAAVEAARAGVHGKGFAVVADEVRNLAAKSAEAAKDTNELISDSIEKSKLGTRLANETAESLDQIISNITENNAIVKKIIDSVDDQTSTIDKVNADIERVATITHNTSAAAEESAAASEEMSAQADVLKDLVARFNLNNNAVLEGKIKEITHALPGH